MKEKHVPLRTCMVTRKKMPKSELVRFVYDPDTKQVNLDPSGKVRGRGANMVRSLEVFDRGVENRSFNRAFKTKIDDKNLQDLRIELEKYINRQELKNDSGSVIVRIKGEPVKI